MRIRLLLVTVSATLFLASCTAVAAPHGAGETSAVAEVATIGSTVEAGEWQVTIHSWATEASGSPATQIPDYVAPPQFGKEAAVMDVTLKYVGSASGNTSEVSILYIADENPIPSGREIPLSEELSASALPEGEVRHGEEVSGDAYFAIEPGSRGTFRVSAPGMNDAITIAP